MSKEACCFIIDVHPSMDEILIENSEQTRLDVAKHIAKKILLQKMLFSTSDEVAIILLGTKDSHNECYDAVAGQKFQHITVLDSFHQPSIKSLYEIESKVKIDTSSINSFSSSTTSSTSSNASTSSTVAAINTSSGSLYEAIFVADTIIDAKVGKRKFQRNIYILTDRTEDSDFASLNTANSSFIATREQFEQSIITNVTGKNTKINIIYTGAGIEDEDNVDVGTDTGTDRAAADVDVEENEEGANVAKVSPFLSKVAKSCNGYLVAYKQLLQLLAQPTSKQFQPRSLSATLHLSKVTCNDGRVSIDPDVEQVPLVTDGLDTDDPTSSTIDPTIPKLPRTSIPIVFTSHTLQEKFPNASSEFHDPAVTAAAIATASGLDSSEYVTIPPTSDTFTNIQPVRITYHPAKPDVEVTSDMVIGYKYGQDFIPVSAAELDLMKVEKQPSSFEIICFMKKCNLPYDDMTGGVNVVMPSPTAHDSQRHCVAFAKLVDAMIGLDVVAIVRFTRHSSANPKLCVLFPDVFVLPDDASVDAGADAGADGGDDNNDGTDNLQPRVLYAVNMGFEEARKHYQFTPPTTTIHKKTNEKPTPMSGTKSLNVSSHTEGICTDEDIKRMSSIFHLLDFDNDIKTIEEVVTAEAEAVEGRGVGNEEVDIDINRPKLFEDMAEIYNPSILRLQETLCAKAIDVVHSRIQAEGEVLGSGDASTATKATTTTMTTTTDPTLDLYRNKLDKLEAYEPTPRYSLLRHEIIEFGLDCPVVKSLDPKDSKGRRKKVRHSWREFFQLENNDDTNDTNDTTSVRFGSIEGDESENRERRGYNPDSLDDLPHQLFPELMGSGSGSGNINLESGYDRIKTEENTSTSMSTSTSNQDGILSALQSIKNELVSSNMFQGYVKEENMYDKAQEQEHEQGQNNRINQENQIEAPIIAKIYQVQAVGTAVPVGDMKELFEYYIASVRRKELDYDGPSGEEIIHQCMVVVSKLLDSPLRFSLVDKVIDCIAAIRHYSIQMNTPDVYNNFLDELRDRYESDHQLQLWKKLVDYATKLSALSSSSSSSSLPPITVAPSSPSLMITYNNNSATSTSSYIPMIIPIHQAECLNSSYSYDTAIEYMVKTVEKPITTDSSFNIPYIPTTFIAADGDDDEFGFGDIE